MLYEIFFDLYLKRSDRIVITGILKLLDVSENIVVIQFNF